MLMVKWNALIGLGCMADIFISCLWEILSLWHLKGRIIMILKVSMYPFLPPLLKKKLKTNIHRKKILRLISTDYIWIKIPSYLLHKAIIYITQKCTSIYFIYRLAYICNMCEVFL